MVHGVAKSDPTEWLHFHSSLSCIGEGNGTPLQCSCLENPRGGGAWWAAVYGVTQSQTRLKWLSSSSRESTTSLSVGEYLNKQLCILYGEMLPSNKKAGNIDTLYNLDDSRELYANWEEASLKRSHMIWIYLCNVLGVTDYKNEKINGFQELEEGHRVRQERGCGNKRLARGTLELTDIFCIWWWWHIHEPIPVTEKGIELNTHKWREVKQMKSE